MQYDERCKGYTIEPNMEYLYLEEMSWSELIYCFVFLCPFLFLYSFSMLAADYQRKINYHWS